MVGTTESDVADVEFAPILRALGRGFHFDKAALLANRQGRLVRRQIWRAQAAWPRTPRT